MRTSPRSTKQFGDLLDYGCGIGADVTYYLNHGLDAKGYDPHPPSATPICLDASSASSC